MPLRFAPPLLSVIPSLAIFHGIAAFNVLLALTMSDEYADGAMLSQLFDDLLKLIA
jgi:hypothetical protein